jgi:HSP20 family protein
MKAKTRELSETTPRRELGVLDEMDRVFENLFARGWMRPFREMWPDWARTPAWTGAGGEELMELRMPRVELTDREDEYVVRAELPGVKRDDLTLELAGDVLTIKGEKRHEKHEEKGETVRSEIAYGAYGRTIALPTGVDPEAVKAEFHDGVLEVHLPKVEKTERRRITVG